MNVEKNIEVFIEEQLPANFRQEGPLLVKFMEYYYEWLALSGNAVGASRDLTKLSDPDEISDEFIDFLRKEFMSSIPVSLQVDQRLLLKNILNFYQSRGSESSYRLLFRILYNAEINIYYPGDDILRTSDGRWTVDKYIEVDGLIADAQNIAIIQGKTSKAKARIDRIEEQYDSNSVIRKRIYLTNIDGGSFQSGEEIIEYGKTIVICKTVGTMVTEPGKWIGTYGQLSSNKRLQDNFYYQEFSYEIQSPVGTNSYREIVKSLVHPAGTKLFGKVLGQFEIDLSPFSGISQFVSTPEKFNLAINLTGNISVSTFYDKSPNIFTVNFNSPIIEMGLGKISIGITSLGDLQDIKLGDMSSIPMGLLGNRKLVLGHQTDFISQINQPQPLPLSANPINLNITDTDNADVVNTPVDYTFSPGALLLRNDYPHSYMFKEDYRTEITTYVMAVSHNMLNVSNSNIDIDGDEITGSNFLALDPDVGLEIVISGDSYYTFISSIVDDTTIILTDDFGITSTGATLKIYDSPLSR